MASIESSAVVVTSDKLSFVQPTTIAAALVVEIGATLFFAPGIAERVLGAGAVWFILAALAAGFLLKWVYWSGDETAYYDPSNRIVPPQAWKLPLLVQHLALAPLCCLAIGQSVAAASSTLLQRPQQQPQSVPVTAIAVTAAAVAILLSRSGEIRRRAGVRTAAALAVFFLIAVVWGAVTMATGGTRWAGALGGFPPYPAATDALAAFGYGWLFLGALRALPRLWRSVSAPKATNIAAVAKVSCTFALIVGGAIVVLVAVIVPVGVRPGATLMNLAASLAGPPAVRGAFAVVVLLIAITVLLDVARASLLAGASLAHEVFDLGTLTSRLPEPIRSRSVISEIVIPAGAVCIATIIIARNSMVELVLLYGFTVWTGILSDTVRMLIVQPWRVSGGARKRGRVAGFLALLSVSGLAMLLRTPLPALCSGGVVIGLWSILAFRMKWVAGSKRDRTQDAVRFQSVSSTDLRTVQVRPGAVLVAVRDPNRLDHLRAVLTKTNQRRNDIVVMTASLAARSAPDFEIGDNRSFSEKEQELFQRVAHVAEQHGKDIPALLTVAATDAFQAMVNTAAALQASRLVTSVSATMDSNALARRIGKAWERLPEPRHAFSLEIIATGRESLFINLGPHPPRLFPEDVDLTHALWLELSDEIERLHHRDIVGAALRRIEQDLHGERRQEAVDAIKEQIRAE